MKPKMTEIDIESWGRKQLFEAYLPADLPYIIVTANVDATRVLEFAHDNKVSFNLAMSFLANKTADSIENYRYRFKDGKAYVLEYNRPLVNHLREGEDQFIMVEGPWPCDDILEFCRISKAMYDQASPDQFKVLMAGQIDLINYTTLPWIPYTAFFRTVTACKTDTNPKISFGKYTVTDGKVSIPVTSQTHHGLMDGRHVGMFYQRLQENIDKL